MKSTGHSSPGRTAPLGDPRPIHQYPADRLTRRNLLAGIATSPLLPAASTQHPGSASETRRSFALQLRVARARRQNERPLGAMVSNGDEAKFPNWIACFTKGLPQNQFGEVDPLAYKQLLHALSTAKHADFEQLPRGGGRKLNDPEAAFAYQLEGGDPHTFDLPPAPSLDLSEAAWEMAELYWQAVCRDIPFSDYPQSTVIQQAATGLKTSPTAIFRGPTPADLKGPYISQFLLKPIPCGSGKLEQRYRVPKRGSDFMTTVNEWSQIQLGVPPWREASFEASPRYMITGRDLAEFVHYDYSFQAYLNAALILFDNGPHTILNCNPFRSFANPYRNSRIQDGFVTFGQAEVMDWLGRISTAALKAAYCHKWLIHRRLRPEALGGLIHQTNTGIRHYPLPPALCESSGMRATFAKTGSYLLPQAYPEGCPLHPSYPAGHAALAGACATVLKACFEEKMLFPGCVVPSPDGQSLLSLPDYAPTIGDEVNKLAFNISMARDWAGIHYRSDATAGLRLGEDVAISILEDLVCTYTEDFKGFSFTRLDGTKIRITSRAGVTVI